MNDIEHVITLMPDGTFSHRYEHAPYLWPDRPNDEYANAKHVWKWFAAGYVILWIGMYCVV